MIREPLFKAKQIDSNEKEWVEGYVSRPHIRDSKKSIESYYFNAIDEKGWTFECIVSAETVCEYTGMTAYWFSSDTELQNCCVWEHDLLEVLYKGKKVIAEVVFDCGMFILASNEFADTYIPLSDVTEIEDGKVYVNAKIVGNVFDLGE